MQKLGACLALLLMLCLMPGEVSASRSPVVLEEVPTLPLRILTRPMATLYKDASEETVVKSNLPTFHPYFVYTKPGGEARGAGSGWYEIGTDDSGTVIGWLKASDVFEWKQTMCVYYTHPQGRKPVLMFEYEDQIDGIVKEAPATRTASVTQLYSDIDQAATGGKVLPDDFPVLSVEPKMAIDKMEQFYLLPILEHKAIQLDGREARLLNIAAVVAGGEKTRESSDIRANSDYIQAAASEGDSSSLQDLKVDFVWVIDTTRSMGPYIDATRKTVEQASRQMAETPELAKRIAFGLWAFRDTDHVSGLEYNTRNFTPKLMPVASFLETSKGVKETAVDSGGFDENVFAGMDDAVRQTAWRDGAIRILCLVGDAPGHELNNPRNSAGLDAQTLRSLATDANVTIFSIHIVSPNTNAQNRVARRQFSTMSTNPGTDKASYFDVPAKDTTAFSAVTDKITNSILQMVSSGLKGSMLADDGTGDKGDDGVGNALRAATVTWLGSQSKAAPPRDIEAWVTDKDLTEPTIQSLEVRLLLSKQQLDSLSVLLSDVIEAGRTSQMNNEDFFASLQATSAMASRDPDMLASSKNLGESGMMGSFLSGLPYHSQLMDMSNELWASWGPDEQDQFVNNLDAKLRAYSAIHDDPARWVTINKGDDPSDAMTPLSLELLP